MGLGVGSEQLVRFEVNVDYGMERVKTFASLKLYRAAKVYRVSERSDL